MANSILRRKIAGVKQKVAGRLGDLVSIQIERQGTDIDPVTGECEFEAAETVDARIEGSNRLVRAYDGSLQYAQHRVTLWDRVSIGDKLTWGGDAHIVLHIEGLLRDTTGRRYLARAVTD